MESIGASESPSARMQRAIDAVLADSEYILARNYRMIREWNIDLIVDTIGTLASDEVHAIASGANYTIDKDGRITIASK